MIINACWYQIRTVLFLSRHTCRGSALLLCTLYYNLPRYKTTTTGMKRKNAFVWQDVNQSVLHVHGGPRPGVRGVPFLSTPVSMHISRQWRFPEQGTTPGFGDPDSLFIAYQTSKIRVQAHE